MRRRLPVYLLIDTSGSMRGEPIAAVNNGLDTMIGALKQDPQALENVHLTLITFDIEAKVVHDMTPLDSLLVQPLDTPQSGPTHMGEALEEVLKRVPEDVRKGSETEKGDYQPLLFLMTDGKPSDTMAFDAAVGRIRTAGFANIVGCAAGPKGETGALQRFCDQVVSLDTMDTASFHGFFKWVSEAIAKGSHAQGTGEGPAELPPPPDEIKVVL